MAAVNTVLGQMDSADLGRTLIHEHALVGFPGWFLDNRQPKFERQQALAVVVEAFARLKDYGVRTVVDPCPSDLGRDVEFYAEVAQRTGLNFICATGLYYEAAGLTYTFRRMEEEAIADIFQKEIEDGVGQTGIRPGVIKIASGKGERMSAYERKTIGAAGKAAKRTGLPVLSHTEQCCCGHEQIDLITGAGVRADRLLVGHSDGTEDVEYQASLAARGVFVGFDRFGLEIYASDEQRMTNLKALVDRGYRAQIMMSHDYVACWKGGVPGLPPGVLPEHNMPNWQPTHIFERIIPELKRRGMTEADFDAILSDNPRRFLMGTEA